MRSVQKIMLVSLAALLVMGCGEERRSSKPADGAEGEGEPAAEGEGEGEPAEGEGEGEGGGIITEGEGEGPAEGEGEPPVECPPDLPDYRTYNLDTPDCVRIYFDYWQAPQSGNRPVALLLHQGLIETRRAFEEVPGFIDTLRCHGITVLNADLRGHLQSVKRECTGVPGQSCEADRHCLSGTCGEDLLCEDFASCDAQAEEPECPDDLTCDFFGRCGQSVRPREDPLIRGQFVPEDWYKIAADIDGVLETLDLLANWEIPIRDGQDGTTTEAPDQFIIILNFALAETLQNMGLEPSDLDMDFGLFMRIPVAGELRNYSIRMVEQIEDVGPGKMSHLLTLRSDKEGDWKEGENEDGFYSTTPLTETLSESAWGMLQRSNFPFDSERFLVIGSMIGGHQALRYAAREDAGTRLTVMISPMPEIQDDMPREDFKALAQAVSTGKVLAIAAADDDRSQKVLRSLDSAENPNIETLSIEGAGPVSGVTLLQHPGVVDAIMSWLRANL